MGKYDDMCECMRVKKIQFTHQNSLPEEQYYQQTFNLNEPEQDDMKNISVANDESEKELVTETVVPDMTFEEFCLNANNIFNYQFMYDESHYTNMSTEMEIHCLRHGEIKITPADHLVFGCHECKEEKEEYVKKAKEIYGDKYNYDQIYYVSHYSNIKVICPEHGAFFVLPDEHLTGKECTKCSELNTGKKKTRVTDYNRLFHTHGKKKHNDKYGYFEVICKDETSLLPIICEKHGHFYMNYHDHIRKGKGCPHCDAEKKGKVIEKPVIEKITGDTTIKEVSGGKQNDRDIRLKEFIEKARKKHGDKYDYSVGEYVNSYTNISIRCKEHGIFQQRPKSHCYGCGCPKCGRLKARSLK